MNNKTNKNGRQRRVPKYEEEAPYIKRNAPSPEEPQKKKTTKSKKGFSKYWNAFVKNLRKNLGNLVSKNKKGAPIVLYAIIAAAAVIVIYNFLKSNSYAVYVNEDFVCNINLDKDYTAEMLKQAAVTKLADIEGTKVQVNEEVKLTKARAAKKEIMTNDYARDSVYKKFTYKIEGYTINIDGNDIVTLKNMGDVDKVIEQMAMQYLEENATLISKEIVQEHVFNPKFINSDEASTVDEAVMILSNNSEKESTYTVVSGDTASALVGRFNMSIEKLKEMNPGLNPDSLSVGQELNIISGEPVVSIRTVQEIKQESTVPMITDVRENNFQAKDYEKVLQQGKDGVSEITARVTKLNDITESTEAVSEIILEPAVKHVVEIGTREG